MEPLNDFRLYNTLNIQLKLFFSISLGIFLFFLFFEPFGPIYNNVNEKLLFYSGLGGITFFFAWLFRFILPWLYPRFAGMIIWNISSDKFIYALVWVFNSVAFVFYIRYLGEQIMTMYLVFKIVLLCLLPVIILKIKDYQFALNKMIQSLMENNKQLLTQFPENDEKVLHDIEVFTSENNSEVIKLAVDELILVKSADNYVELLFKDNERIQQKLIRNTIRNVENQLRKHPSFIRCHRSYIINKKFVRDFKRGYTGYRLRLSEYNEEIPVSRQYLVLVKESITAI